MVHQNRLFVLFFVWIVSFGPLSSAQDVRSSRASQNSPFLHFGLMQAVEQFGGYEPKVDLRGEVIYRGSSSMSDLGHRLGSEFRKFHP